MNGPVFCFQFSEKIVLVTENEATENRRKLGEDNPGPDNRKEGFEITGKNR